jgi:hypothetical protein
MIPSKTFKAAEHHFKDSLTLAHQKSAIHEYNITAGLYHLACALEREVASLNARLAKIEERLPRQE